MDATKKPLRIPPQFGVYAEKHKLFDLFKNLTSDLIVSKPEDPVKFLISELKKEDNDVPRIIIQGPPAAGKRSIAKMICKKLRTAHVTMSELLSDEVSPLAIKLKEVRDKGEEVPTELLTALVKQRLDQFDCTQKGWLLEGYPNTKEQAHSLQVAGIHPKHCVFMEAPDTVLIERNYGKKIDPLTGDVYHSTFDWPLRPEVVERLVDADNENEIVERFVTYHRHYGDIYRCYQKISKIINVDQPKADIFLQVLTFLGTNLRTLAPHTPCIILLGPTGSGKSTQAALLAAKYNLIDVSTGQLIKQAIADGGKLGESVKPYVQRNMLVPENLMMKLLDARLSQLDCTARGWVLHGFPSTREQAQGLADAGYEPTRVFFLDLPYDSIMERLTLRGTDPVTGEQHHSIYRPPLDQQARERVATHPKDQQQAVKEQLSAYSAYLEEIAEFYEEQAQHINGDQDPHTVFECIESMLVNSTPKSYIEDEAF